MYFDIPVHDNINNCVDKTARRSSNVVQATTLKPQNWNSYCCCCCCCWCKQSVPRSRRITSPTPHHSTVTGQMLFLMPNQQCQSTEGTNLKYVLKYVHETNALSHSNLSVPIRLETDRQAEGHLVVALIIMIYNASWQHKLNVHT